MDDAKKNPDYKMAAVSMFQFLNDFPVAREAQEPFSQGRNPFSWPKLPGLK